MSDNKFNSDLPEIKNILFTDPGVASDADSDAQVHVDKSEVLDFSLGKTSQKAIDELNETINELDHKLEEELTAERVDKVLKDLTVDADVKRPEFTADRNAGADSVKPDLNHEKHKVMPDLNLKGIKVERIDNIEVEPFKKPAKKVESKPDLAINKKAEKASKPDLDMGEYIKKKDDDEDLTQALPKSEEDKKSASNKPADKKPTDKKPTDKKPTDKKPVDKDKPADDTDTGKTMIMKDTSSIAKAKKKEEKASEKKKAAPVKKAGTKAASQAKPTFNYSIFGGFFLAFGIVVIAFVIAVGALNLGKEYLGIDKPENDIRFNIPEGSTSVDIADLLKENHLIDNKLLFRIALKFNAPETIYPGDITLQPSLGYSGIIQKLGEMREKYKTTTISFPEGVTLLGVANLLEKNEVCKADDFLFEFNKEQGYDFEKLITGNEDAFYHMEGYFFPDTYEFYLNDDGYNITKTVREHFEKQYNKYMNDKIKKSNLTLNQVMTLASMVQWESGSVDDMPKVASVFLNRMNDSDTFPRFESDATQKYIENVIKTQADTTADLDHFTESYDTYQSRGLPAGPICNPGIDAINAVLNPEKTDYYYFCNNLKTGESFFAKTLEEHEVNLKKAGLK